MPELKVKIIQGLQPYQPIWQAMRDFTDRREANTWGDEIWLVEHQAVFTQGQAGKPEHVLNPHDIPIIQTDRGGQVTYHGPGQLMIYTLLNIRELELNTRDYVRKLERCIIDYLKTFAIDAKNKVDAPGIYVGESKICSIGLRVRKGFSYHGLALNVKMDLTPFSYINPCGFKSLKMTQLSEYVDTTMEQVIKGLLPTFLQKFGYNKIQTTNVTLTELTNYDQTTAL